MSDKPPRAATVHPLEDISPGNISLDDNLLRVLAPNPSPMTHWGTNTYLLGDTSVAVIDPGPLDEAHLAAVISAIGGRQVSHILITHSHLDHSALARPLAEKTGAQIYAFGNSDAGRSPVMQHLGGALGGGEGVDTDFRPDVLVRTGDKIAGAGWALEVLHTPGHFGNHVCYIWGDRVFTGDHVMGWASSLVSPPDGDLTDFMASCRALHRLPLRHAYPGHGAPIADFQARLKDLIVHRESRETEILAALQNGPKTPEQITRMVYHDTPSALLGMATRNVFAHLIDLSTRGRAAPLGRHHPTAEFVLI